MILFESWATKIKHNWIIEHIWIDWKYINWVLYKNCKIVSFEWNEYIVSNNAVLTIQLTDICNANCNFCFNWITFYPKWTSKNIDSIKRVLLFCETAWIESIAISWGEPTINISSLIDLVNLIKWIFKDYRIHSNWLNLFKAVDDTWELLIDYLARNWINKITLSLAHYDFRTNWDLMWFKWKFKWLNTEQIKYLWDTWNKVSTRLSCFLNKNWIFTNNDVEEYISFGVNCGIRNFIFRVWWETDIAFLKDTKYVDFWNENKLNLDDIVKYFISIWYKEKFSLHKSDLHVHVLEKDWITIDFEESSEEVDQDDKIRRINYFWNWITYTSWIDPSSILFDSDKEKVIDQCVNNTKLTRSWTCPSSDLWRSLNSRVQALLENKTQFPVDLHTHTINSDWKETSKEVLEKARDFWVKILTITEHNFISEDEYRFVREYWESMWISIPFPWVEINVVTTNKEWNPDRKHHLLAYWEWLLDSQFQDLIALPNRIKFNYYWEIIENLQQRLWIKLPSINDMMMWIDEEWNYKTPYKKLITRTIIAKYIQKRIGWSIDEIKRLYLPLIPEEISYKEYNRAEDIIPIVRELWWISWLAHPWWDRPFYWKWTNKWIDYKHLLSELWRLRRLWMSWIEIYHKTHILETKQILQRFVQELMLLNIWWSDYHGKVNTNPDFTDIQPWTFGLTIEEYEKISKLIK